MALHPSITQRACDVLVFHPECPPMTEGTEGLAYAMEAAIEAAVADLVPDDVERARSLAVHLEQDAAEGRRVLSALVAAFEPDATPAAFTAALGKARDHLGRPAPTRGQPGRDQMPEVAR